MIIAKFFAGNKIRLNLFCPAAYPPGASCVSNLLSVYMVFPFFFSSTYAAIYFLNYKNPDEN